MSRKLKAEHDNPCLKEHKLSLKCLEKYSEDKDKCKLYFENYRNCKKFWGKIRAERRAQGITPNLPPPEEREAIKAQYIKNQNVNY